MNDELSARQNSIEAKKAKVWAGKMKKRSQTGMLAAASAVAEATRNGDGLHDLKAALMGLTPQLEIMAAQGCVELVDIGQHKVWRVIA